MPRPLHEQRALAEQQNWVSAPTCRIARSRFYRSRTNRAARTRCVASGYQRRLSGALAGDRPTPNLWKRILARATARSEANHHARLRSKDRSPANPPGGTCPRSRACPNHGLHGIDGSKWKRESQTPLDTQRWCPLPFRRPSGRSRCNPDFSRFPERTVRASVRQPGHGSPRENCHAARS